MKSIYVVFTASVNPHAQASITAGNLSREDEYIEAISANVRLGRLSGVNATYILAENSEAAAMRLRSACGQLGVRFMQCAVTPEGFFKGKGHSEALMLNEVIERLPDEPSSMVLLKVTGRLQVQNMDRLICAARNTSSDSLVNLYSRAKYADTRVMVISGSFWKLVMPLVETIDDSKHRYLEHIVPLAISTATKAGLKCDYLLPPPQIRGRSASTGQIYETSPAGYALEYLKILAKKFIYRQRKL
ncbi:hypothetical protein [Opitutus sp. GAS368]|uniref:hypothetical protein n=1 Tax=Opitutus sp. GAS368 TaxID=1882749 RepID=UPI00087BDAC8|nr:hypothetical protein [Opitutus sp. GAS368]SDS46302.1 hypothetical protein SAMN05444173_2962 [Opitutus sp. GAS368]